MGSVVRLAGVLILVACFSTANAAEPSSPQEKLRQNVRSASNFARKYKKEICATFVLANAFTGLGFYLGIQYTAPPERVVITEKDVPPNSPLLTVVDQRLVYGVVDGEVIDAGKETLPDSENTKMVFGFRGSLFKLSNEGKLAMYRNRSRTWVEVESEPFKEAYSSESAIVGVTESGDLYEFNDTRGGFFNLVDGKPVLNGIRLDFQKVGQGYNRLQPSTSDGRFTPDAVTAFGTDIMHFSPDGKRHEAKAGTPEHEFLRAKEQELK